MLKIIKAIFDVYSLRFVLNSLLSVLTRFMLVFILADTLKFNFLFVHWGTYLYVLVQSYSISKYYVFKSKKTNYIKFIFFNISISALEYLFILFMVETLKINYSTGTILIGFATFLTRYMIYRYIIFRNE